MTLRLESQRRARGELLTQEIAGRDVREAQAGLQPLRLRALAGTRRAEEDKARYRRNPSYWRIIICDSTWRIVSSATPTTMRIDVPPKTPKNTFDWGR